MIKFLHFLFIRDWPLKVFSLTLATLTWMAVSFSREKQVVEVEGSPTRVERRFFDQPIRLLSGDANVSRFMPKPTEVDVVVQGEANIITNLRASQIHVVVDLTGKKPATNAIRPIEVVTPIGVTCVHLIPTETEIIPPPPPAKPTQAQPPSHE